MFYTKRLAKGWGAVYRAAAHQGIVVRFRADALPYLGCGSAMEDGRRVEMTLGSMRLLWNRRQHPMELFMKPRNGARP
jgi:hypothetical protein